MKITPIHESIVSSLPFRSVAWGAQATRGELEILALEVGESVGQTPRLPRGGVGASEVNPRFTLAMREQGALKWLKNAGHNPRVPKETRDRVKDAIHKAESVLSGGKVKPKKSFDF